MNCPTIFSILFISNSLIAIIFSYFSCKQGVQERPEILSDKCIIWLIYISFSLLSAVPKSFFPGVPGIRLLKREINIEPKTGTRFNNNHHADLFMSCSLLADVARKGQNISTLGIFQYSDCKLYPCLSIIVTIINRIRIGIFQYSQNSLSDNLPLKLKYMLSAFIVLLRYEVLSDHTANSLPLGSVK